MIIYCQILVSVLNPLSPKKTPVEEPVEDPTQPTITLEVNYLITVESFFFQLFINIIIG